MKTVITIITASLLLAGVAYAKPGSKGERKPPQEAIDACVDKSEGDQVTFITPRGDELVATCQIRHEQLIAVPEGHEKSRQREES